MQSVPDTDDPTSRQEPLSTSGAKADDERRRLLSAAKEVLERTGWWGFKVEGVLRQANLSTRSFYRHFEKKSDLLAALMERELGAAAVKLHRVTTAGADAAEKVDNFIGALIDMAYEAELSRPSSLFASHWREMLPEYGDAIDRCVRTMMQPIVDTLTEGAATGALSSSDPEADARAIFYLVASITADQAVVGGIMPREELERCTIPFVHRAIGLA